jgi:hypothetical protein
MTAITHPSAIHARRSTLRAVVRRSTRGLAALVRWLRAEVVAFASSTQLGPDTETETGRWTGARV